MFAFVLVYKSKRINNIARKYMYIQYSFKTTLGETQTERPRDTALRPGY